MPGPAGYAARLLQLEGSMSNRETDHRNSFSAEAAAAAATVAAGGPAEGQDAKPTDHPAAWASIRAEIYAGLRALGMKDETAKAKAELAADAAIVTAGLVNQSKARQMGWVRVSGTERMDAAGREAVVAIETAVLEVSTLATVTELAIANIDFEKLTHHAAAYHLLGGLMEAARKVGTTWDAAFAAYGFAPRNTDVVEGGAL